MNLSLIVLSRVSKTQMLERSSLVCSFLVGSSHGFIPTQFYAVRFCLISDLIFGLVVNEIYTWRVIVDKI